MSTASQSVTTIPSVCCLCEQQVHADVVGATEEQSCPGCGLPLLRSQVLLNEVREEIVEQFQAEPSSITAMSRLQDFGKDSLELLELIMMIEDRLDIHVQDGQAQNFATVGDFVRFVLASESAFPSG